MEIINEKYGVWNRMTKRFVFGVEEPTKKSALKTFKKLVGKHSYCCRYEIKKFR